jgi:hypothetical protein
MGKRAKSARAEKRKQAKRAKKASLRALYESYRGSGQNKKSKRFKLGNRRKKNTVKDRITISVIVEIGGILVSAPRRVHASSARCGNHACKKPACRG